MDKRNSPHSEEHRSKISLAQKAKGELHWTKRPEVREKMRLAKLGKKAGMTGKHHSIETKKKLSLAFRGKRAGAECNLWKGGINKLTWAIRKCWKYLEWRSSVFERDNYTCQDCGNGKGIFLEAHHIKAFSVLLKENNIKSVNEAISCEQLWSINNGLTLCKECHKKTDSYLKGRQIIS